jgi:hypothetical protein
MVLSGRSFVVAASLVVALAVPSAAAPPAPDLSRVTLRREQRDSLDLQPFIRAHRLTAIIFYSATCPCFTAHLGRIAALVRELGPRDVQFIIVDPERRRPPEVPASTLPEVGLPVFRDDEGRLARLLDAQFATQTFVFDAKGALRYRGGIDGDRKELSESPQQFLRDALLRLLSGDAPELATAKALGCILRSR